MKISQLGKLHTRRVYGLFDLMGDIGGVGLTFIAFFGYFIAPVAKFSFIVAAAENLFFARCKDKNMFGPD